MGGKAVSYGIALRSENRDCRLVVGERFFVIGYWLLIDEDGFHRPHHGHRSTYAENQQPITNHESRSFRRPFIELPNQRVDFGYLRLDALPVFRIIPLSKDLLVGPALLLHPGEVLQIVDSPTIGIAQLLHVVRALTLEKATIVRGGIELRVVPVLLAHLLQPAAVELHGIGEHGEHYVVLPELVVLGELDRHEQGGGPRETEQVEVGDKGLRDDAGY